MYEDPVLVWMGRYANLSKGDEEVTWLATKHFLQKAWTWIKHHWYVPLLVIVAFVLAVFLARKSDVATKLLKTRSESYKEQIGVLNESHAGEIARRDEIIRIHQEVMGQLDEQLESDLQEVDRRKEKRIKELIEENHDNPEALSRALGDAFGIQYVPRDEQ